MQLRKLYYLLLILPLLFINPACSDDDTTTDPPVVVNEAEVLVEYLEASGAVINTFPQMITANTVNINITTAADQYIIDIRGATDYDAGHITGAVNVAHTEVLVHYEALSLETKEVVVIVCYSGQSAAWVTGLLHTMGYTNARDMKWGMCSWNEATSVSWTSSTNVNNSRASEFVTTATARPAAGDLPTLDTGKETGPEILIVRVEAVFAEGFTPAAVGSDDVYAALSDYFILNYWVETDYSWGHIDGAMQYTPKESLVLDADLKTLATDKPVAVYCYTGQTSAHVAAYLRVLGYDAKSIKFGVNGMSYDTMPGTKFDPDNDINDYELVQ